MDFESIRIFLRVAERGSFTGAAAQLGLPLTSVSRRVKALEDALGIQLLYRTTRRVWVTEAGREYYERCVRAEEILEEADRTAQTHKREPEGTLRVLMPYTLGLVVVEPRLSKFRQRYPKVQLVLTYDNYPLDLIERGFDVALRVGPLPDSGYSARRLGWSRRRLVASPTYLERRGCPENPFDLVGHSVMLMGSTAPLTTVRLIDDQKDIVDVTLRPVLMSNEPSTIIRQASQGTGIALVSSQLAAREVASGALTPILSRWHQADDIDLHALFPPRATLNRKVRVFVDFLATVFSEWNGVL